MIVERLKSQIKDIDQKIDNLTEKMATSSSATYYIDDLLEQKKTIDKRLRLIQEFPTLNISKLLELSIQELIIQFPNVFSFYSVRCFQDCHLLLPLEVFQDNNGYYIGVADFEGPLRESEEYFSCRTTAEKAIYTGDWKHWSLLLN